MNTNLTSHYPSIIWTDQLLVSIDVYLHYICVVSMFTVYSLYTAPGDYVGGPYSVSFTAGQASSTVSVSTVDDSIAELDEHFKVMITGSNRPSKVRIGDPDTCYVTIEDNDGETSTPVMF